MKRKKEHLSEDLAKLFLTNFVGVIIENTAEQLPPLAIQKIGIEKVGPIGMKTISPLMPQVQPLSLKILENVSDEESSLSIMHEYPEIENETLPIVQHAQQKTPPQIKQQFPPQSPIQSQAMFPQIKKPAQFTLPIMNIPNLPLGKLMPMLNDPQVAEIECPGPNKNLNIMRRGQKLTTNLILTQEEIDNIMQEISNKTRIPLIQGMFKAALGNLHISAAISEFIGTSFQIHKIPTPLTLRPMML